ncbi:MAG: ABC transporter ATP-binding protein [Syntrophomonadaceae bacterium]
MLQIKDIRMTINEINGENREILKDLNLSFSPGVLYAITGPNGGGKTSIAKVIMGIYKPDRGQVIMDGEDISSLDVTARARKGIVYAFQQPPRFKGIMVEDLLKIARPGIDNLSLRKSLRDVGLCPEDYLSRDVGPGLSGGEIKRIEIAQVLARKGKVTIFDEPEAGVDLWTVQKIIDIIDARYKNNPDATVIIITHNEKLLHICDEIILIDNGTVQARGTLRDIWPLIREDIECKMKDQCGREDVYEF